MLSYEHLTNGIRKLEFAIVFYLLGTSICYSQTTIFNIQTVNSGCFGLTEQDNAEYLGVCEIVNTLSQAETLDEIKDGIIVGNGRHYLSNGEYNELNKNDPEKLEELIGKFGSWQEYRESQNQISRTLFGASSLLGFYSLVVKRLSCDQDIISIIGDLGYVELIICHNQTDKLGRIAEIRVVKYGQSNAIFYQFYPNGSLMRRFTVKYESPKEIYAIEKRLYRGTPDTDENPLINWQLKACRDFYCEPHEILSNVVKWDENGTFLGVDSEYSKEDLFNQNACSTIGSDENDTSSINSVDKVNRLPLFNFQTRISLPREGMDDHDGNYVQIISEMYRSLSVSHSIDDLFTNVNSALASVDDNGGADNFDVFVWNFANGGSNEITFASFEKIVTLETTGGYQRTSSEFDFPYILTGYIFEAMIREYGNDTSFLVGFYPNGSVKTLFSGKHSRKCYSTFIADVLNNQTFNQILRSLNSSEGNQFDSLFSDYTSAFTTLPKYLIGRESRWDNNGELSFSIVYDKPKEYLEAFSVKNSPQKSD